MLKTIFIYFLYYLLTFLSFVLPLLFAVAFLTLAERKILAAMQRRRGPNVVGFVGVMQPLVDGIKLIIKETIFPSRANKIVFLLSPVFTFFLSLSAWAIIPFNDNFVSVDFNLGLLYIFAISSLSVYGIIMSGWSSNSRYAFLGALRSAAQMVSYEVSIGLTLINILICVGSLNLYDIVEFQRNVWFVIPFFPIYILFFVSALAETNRPPFDLPEAEGELVAGYNVEYSAVGFAMFFISEYANLILMSTLSVLLFWGGWLSPLSLFLEEDPFPSVWWLLFKILFHLYLFVWVRASLPRYRYDQLMRLGWKVFLPLALGYVIFTSAILYIFDWLP